MPGTRAGGTLLPYRPTPGTDRRRTLAVGAQTWTFEYHPSLLLRWVQQALGSVVPMQYQYEPSGLLALREAGSLRRTRYGYDGRGRTVAISHRTYPSPTEITEQEIQYAYGPDVNVSNYNDIVVGNYT